jgi:hypothetical protein
MTNVLKLSPIIAGIALTHLAPLVSSTTAFQRAEEEYAKGTWRPPTEDENYFLNTNVETQVLFRDIGSLGGAVAYGHLVFTLNLDDILPMRTSTYKALTLLEDNKEFGFVAGLAKTR